MTRENFTSRLGLLAAAAGSAIGLGNIWKFPYVVGENGGAAFILVYLICVIIIGYPLMMTEFALGRLGRANPMDSINNIKENTPWRFVGFISTLTPLLILSFYIIIAGWVFNYMGSYITGGFSSIPVESLPNHFSSVAGNSTSAIICALLVLSITSVIVFSGIKDGIEKYCKVLMPVLLVIMIFLAVRSVSLDGAKEGIDFLFKADFSKLTPKSFLEAIGHAFYSLSIAMGILITYGSYIKKDLNLSKLSIQVTLADTLIALTAGIIIFPAVFAYGFEPDAGPKLIFMILPAVFKNMPFGNFFGLLFFTLIGIAAITSTVSLLEVVVSFVQEKLSINRKIATFFSAMIIFILSIPSILSFGALSDFHIFGMNFFDLFDFITGKLLLPLTGLALSIFAGWIWGSKNVLKEIFPQDNVPKLFAILYDIIMKFVAPISILLIFLNQLNLI